MHAHISLWCWSEAGELWDAVMLYCSRVQRVVLQWETKITLCLLVSAPVLYMTAAPGVCYAAPLIKWKLSFMLSVLDTGRRAESQVLLRFCLTLLATRNRMSAVTKIN